MWGFLLVLVSVSVWFVFFFFILALISHFSLYISCSSPLCLSACHQIHYFKMLALSSYSTIAAVLHFY